MLDTFMRAHAQVAEFLTHLDTGRPIKWQPPRPVHEVLRKHRQRPVAAAVAELHERAAHLYAAYALPDLAVPTSAAGCLTVETLDLPREFQAYREVYTPGGLSVLQNRSLLDTVVPHKQFFRPPPPDSRRAA